MAILNFDHDAFFAQKWHPAPSQEKGRRWLLTLLAVAGQRLRLKPEGVVAKGLRAQQRGQHYALWSLSGRGWSSVLEGSYTNILVLGFNSTVFHRFVCKLLLKHYYGLQFLGAGKRSLPELVPMSHRPYITILNKEPCSLLVPAIHPYTF